MNGPYVLLSELRRGERQYTPGDDQVIARLGALMRHAREEQWSLAHAVLRRQDQRGGPLPGLEPLKSEPVFTVEPRSKLHAQQLISSISGGHRAVVFAGFAFQDILGPALDAALEAKAQAILVEDATDCGLEREFKLRMLARDGVTLTTTHRLIVQSQNLRA